MDIIYNVVKNKTVDYNLTTYESIAPSNYGKNTSSLKRYLNDKSDNTSDGSLLYSHLSR